MKFFPGKVYSAEEIESISGFKPTINRLSYATILAVICDDVQYDFVFYPFSEKEGYTLIAVNGNVPAIVIDYMKNSEGRGIN